MIRRPTHRSGATLLEVLIGMGILAVAAISLLSLFPFASLTVAQAHKSDRSTTAAISADALLRDIHKRYVVELGAATTEPYFWAMDNPAAYGVTATPALPAVPTTATTPSYPVYLDPMGMAALRGPVGDSGQTLIPRVNIQYVQNQNPNQNTLALRVASQMDGLTYNADGAVPGGADMRDLRFNVAWMLQRRSNADRYTIRQQVVVYDRRAHLYAPPGSEEVYTGMTTDPGSGTPNTTITGVPTTAPSGRLSEIRKGTWILDAGNAQGVPTAATPIAPLLQAEFYRVVSVTDAGNGTYTLEVHKPIVRADGVTTPYTASIFVVMPAVCDVYERPPLTAAP
jgi:hypothetical protein